MEYSAKPQMRPQQMPYSQPQSEMGKKPLVDSFLLPLTQQLTNLHHNFILTQITTALATP